MFSELSLRQQFIGIVLIATVVGMSIVIFVAFRGRAATAREQATSLLIQSNQGMANALDTHLQQIATLVQGLAAVSASEESPPGLLLDIAAQHIGNPDTLLHGIGIARAAERNEEAIVYHQPDSDGSVATVLGENATLASWLFVTPEQNDAVWFGPLVPDYLSTGEAMMIVVVPFQDSGGQQAGLLWGEVLVSDIERLVEGQLAQDSPRPNRGYTVLVTEQGFIAPASLLGANFDQETEQYLRNVPMQEAQALSGPVAASGSRFTRSADPLRDGSEALIINSIMPQTGWQVVTIFPFELVANPLASAIFVSILILIVTVTVLGWSISRFANSSIIKPLTALAIAAREIGTGDMRYQIDYTGRNDEISELALALETMKLNIAHSYEQLSGWNQKLEQRVAERTQQLEAAQQEAQTTASELRTIYDASLSVVSAVDLAAILQRFSDHVIDLLRANYCGVWLADAEKELQLSAHTFVGKQQRSAQKAEGELAALVLQQARSVILNDCGPWSVDGGGSDPRMKRTLSVPLIFSEQKIGAVVVTRTCQEESFSIREENLLTLLANLVSPVGRNAQLFIQLREAMREAERASNIKTRFLASITHELRTPLNLIINTLDFMRIGTFGEVTQQQNTRLDQSIHSAEHLLYLINDLLDISKIEAGEMQLSVQPADIYPIIDDVLEMTKALVDRKEQLHLETNIPDNLPQIPMDTRRVRQVLLNLLSNAVKYTEQGSITLSASLEDSHVKFVVADSGIGIAEDEFDKLFKAFERTDMAKQRNIEGTGLGLPISQHLVVAHNGGLTVESEVGRGSTFSFTLPLHAVNERLTEPIGQTLDPAPPQAPANS